LFSVSADVDFWVNGGWNQPGCWITINPLYFLDNNQTPRAAGKNGLRNYVKPCAILQQIFKHLEYV
jgi:hypothetical protein